MPNASSSIVLFQSGAARAVSKLPAGRGKLAECTPGRKPLRPRGKAGSFETSQPINSSQQIFLAGHSFPLDLPSRTLPSDPFRKLSRSFRQITLWTDRSPVNEYNFARLSALFGMPTVVQRLFPRFSSRHSPG